MTRITWTALLGLAVVVAMTVPAQAVVVKNTTTGQTIFQDSGFENVAPGDAPVADIGTWVPKGSGNGRVSNIFDPGAHAGANFLLVNGSSATDWHGVFTNPPLAGQTIQATFMVRLLTDNNYNSNFGFSDQSPPISTPPDYHMTQLADKGLTLFDPNGGAGGGTVTRGSNGVWHKVEVTHTAGSTTASSFRVDDGPALAINVGAGPTKIPVSLYFGNAGGQASYDAVPEPVTLSLLGLGGLMMLRRRRRVA